MERGDWVARYLRRIGFEGEPKPDEATLARLHRAHMLSVPFENLNIPLGFPVETTLETLFDKVVVGRRGGFCYELNHLFGHLLKTLGFKVDLLSAGVWSQGRFGPPFDHLLLAVHLADQRFIADVGFGDSFREPFPILGEARDSLGVAYRVNRRGETLVLQQQKPDAPWVDQYRFTLEPQTIDAFQPMCRYHQSSPESSFTRRCICTMATADGRTTLANGRLIRTTAGTRTETPIVSEADFRAVLAEHFCVELPAEVSLTPLRSINEPSPKA
ncbi:arylamine N-acetyltransferase family protein [Acanthopleuribacter pedis]|uniref:Arylamine N-acetyltransferase n=1 Tax=Acanthopleuribacter pedis TaxID=442870 RepID=A0A8J7U7G9_9BACT|nr:arylamine N-acetyltransferase [Acanthopleuribacter pedis]MBO1321396.1 arylamine N-acetyltransferase [Acanthopleuribacter pedis]